MSMENTFKGDFMYRNINIKLGEKEKHIIEFLEDKPLKFIFVEALEMYMKAYEGMKENGPAGQAPEQANEKVKKFFDL